MLKQSLKKVNYGPQPIAELENFSPTCGDDKTFCINFSYYAAVDKGK
jgi:hypothetical protein